MAICNLSDLPSLLKPGQCLLGLDYGTKTIGVAVSDPNLTVASPLIGLERRKFAQDVAALLQIMGERNIGGLVIGLPKTPENALSPMAQAARTFASNLLKHPDLLPLNLPIAFWDERFSTAAVQRAMIEADLSRQKRQNSIDKAAAAYILQGALDAMGRNKGLLQKTDG